MTTSFQLLQKKRRVSDGMSNCVERYIKEGCEATPGYAQRVVLSERCKG